jgi:hypothetical protein
MSGEMDIGDYAEYEQEEHTVMDTYLDKGVYANRMMA